MIYRLGSLGDMVIALPCFHLIRQVHPRAKITILTNQPVTGKAAPAMSVLENSGLCDESISYPVGTRNGFELARVWKRIREIQPEMLINLAAARGILKSLRDHLFFRSCGITNIIGTPFRRRDLQVQHTNEGEFERESERLALRLASLGVINLSDQRLWGLELTHRESNQALELLPANQRDFIAVSVGTKVPAKDWGEKNWEKLLALLSTEIPATTLVLLGSAEERARSGALSRVWRGDCVNLCGITSPRISAAVLERCRLFIGHDSGPMHLASVVGVPTLGLFSWVNPPGQWFPGHRSWKFVRVLYPPLPAGGWKAGLQLKHGDSEGIPLLKPQDVFVAAMELWNYHSISTASSFNRHSAKNTL
jgi:ADP-heptose:LPS heptosyltransferase